MFIDEKTDAMLALEQREDGRVFSEDGREVVGWMHCDDCRNPVAVKLNRGGKPYYGCMNCNNQHKPQSAISRGHFMQRMKPLQQTQEVNEHDSSSYAEEAQAEKAEAGAGTETGAAERTGSAERKRGGIRVGAFS